MDQDFSSPNTLQFAESAFRRLFADMGVSRDSIIYLIEKIKKGKIDGRSSSSCVMCHVGEYMTPPPRGGGVKTFEYVFSNRISRRNPASFLKATRHFNESATGISAVWLQTIEQFATHIHMQDTPKNNAYAKKLLEWAYDSLQQRNNEHDFSVENSSYREFSLIS